MMPQIRRFKYLNFFLLFLISTACISAQEPVGISPEDYEKELLENSENFDERQLHEKLIAAAEIRQAAGDLSGAAELFKKASLTLRGEKDFVSLYRSAVLNVEMAFYRAAEADLRAILMFSDDAELRIKATLLTARMKSLQEHVDEALSILLTILKSAEKLPEEAGIWAADFYVKNKEKPDMKELGLFLEENKEKLFSAAADLKPLITPEIIFGGGIINTPETSAAEPENAGAATEAATVGAAVQLGSFTKKENAEDLVKSVGNTGYTAVIKTKTINDRTYFTVTVPAGEQDIQHLIIELKEKGYEGYPVY